MKNIELIYPNKKSENEIYSHIAKAETIKAEIDKPLFISRDNYSAMSSLLNSGYEGQIDLVYIDPPFNTNQVFNVAANRTSTISRDGGFIAYSDEMLPGEYIEYIRERLYLIRKLMSEKASIYLHIDCNMSHYLKVIMDEVFGGDNFLNEIARIKSNPKNFKRSAYGNQHDVILFYAKNKGLNIFNDVTIPYSKTEIEEKYPKTEKDGRRYNTVPVHAPGITTNGVTGGPWRGVMPPAGRHWRTDPAELDKLDADGLIEWSKNGVPRIKKYADEHKGKKIQDIWRYLDPPYPLYPTEKNLEMLRLIVQQSSNPDSVVMDCFAGSGSTLLAANLEGRRWIGIDQSEYSKEVIKKRFDSCDYQYLE